MAWIVGISSVLFDIDVGPRVQDLVGDDDLTPEERQDVAFHAFPVSVMPVMTHCARSMAQSNATLVSHVVFHMEWIGLVITSPFLPTSCIVVPFTLLSFAW